MNETESNNDLSFEDVIRGNFSDSEQGKIEKFLKISESPAEIASYKKRILSPKGPLEIQMAARAVHTEDIFSNLGDMSEVQHADKNRRRHDQKALYKRVYPLYKARLFQVLFRSSALNRHFRDKYHDREMILFRFMNLFKFGTPFYPGEAVCRFVLGYIIPVQRILKPFMKRMYNQGWCNAKGQRILEPYEFNLIVECERCMDVNAANSFLNNRSNPPRAIAAMNSFLGSYYAIVHNPDNVRALLNSVKKILQHIRPGQSDRAVAVQLTGMLHDFFNGDIEENFLIPLFESYLCRTLTVSVLDSMMAIRPVSRTEYYADHKLTDAMSAREEEYRKQLFQTKKELKEELDFLETAQAALDQKTVKHDPRGPTNVLVLSLAIESGLKMIPGFPMYGDFLPQHRALFAAQYFISTLAHVLTKKLEIGTSPTDPRSTSAVLFQGDVFISELRSISSNLKNMRQIAERPFIDDIINEIPKRMGKDIVIHRHVLNLVADSFYSIGRKLFLYGTAPDDAVSRNIPLTLKDFGMYRTQYERCFLLASPQQVKMAVGRNLFQKSIKEILLEITAFCIQYVYNFECAFRMFEPDSNRQDTLKNMLSAHAFLKDNLKALEEDPMNF